MSTKCSRHRFPASVHAGLTQSADRAQLHDWLAGFALAGIVALSLAAFPTPGIAGEDRPTLESPSGTEAPPTTEVEPGGAKSRYVPRVIGFGRNRMLARGRVAERPAVGAVECPACDPLGVFEPSHFNNPTTIDNEWLPLIPGTQRILQGQANRGGGLLPHLVIFTVTDIVKTIGGIPCVVVWDQDINQGVLRESELAFFAQSDEGDVWNSGEYPEEYENGQFIGAENTWIHGIEQAEAGVHVQQNPVVGSRGYQEAIALENDFWDCGRVFSMSQQKVEHGRSDPDRGRDDGQGAGRDTLVVREWAPFDGCEVIQVKTYAEGIGTVLVGALDDPEGETLVLVDARKLGRAEMDAAAAAALALDARGYVTNEHYALTLPAVRVPLHKGWGDHPPAGAIGASPAASSRTFMHVGPNPVMASASISYSVAQAGEVEIGIFDVVGRRIRTLVNQTMAPGIHSVQWDRRDDGGNAVARGVYFARLRTGAQDVRKTIMVGE